MLKGQLNQREKEFLAALDDGIEKSKERGYVPTRFIELRKKVKDSNDIQDLVKRLLFKEHSDGVTKMWELSLLNETMEAIICERFHDLFDKNIVNCCRNKLIKLGYSPKEFQK